MMKTVMMMMIMMMTTLISVKVTGMAMMQSQRSDKDRLKINRFLSKYFFNSFFYLEHRNTTETSDIHPPIFFMKLSLKKKG